MLPRTADFVVVGGGVVGLCAAIEARRRFPGARVLLLEKEPACGSHASGRNSGVLHAGFHYTAESLKARFTREGNRELSAYCEERHLPLRRCGKLVVARDEADLPGLDELLRRGRASGVELQEVTPAEALAIEPRAATHERALFSPTTVSVDPARVMQSLTEDAQRIGVRICTDTAYLRRSGRQVATSRGTVSPGYLINAAGLHADRVARGWGFSQAHRILPFRGLYLQLRRAPGWLRTHVYPVPELAHPFPGVHFTVRTDGQVTIGPTATPALWREHYGGWSGFHPGEAADILRREAALFLRNASGFRTLALRGLRSYSRRELVRQAARLLRDTPPAGEWSWGTPGIRAQLVELRTRKLEMDFRVEGDDRSLHVLNAVSPAFTCALPFSRFLIDQVDGLLHRAALPAGAEALPPLPEPAC